MAMFLSSSCLVCGLEGYHQNSALIARALLETGFLLELFAADPSQISKWKGLDATSQFNSFSAGKVRGLLESTQRLENPERAKRSKILSQIAAHPSALSDQMLRANRGDLAVIGPFESDRLFKSVIEELAYIAVVIGHALCIFMPATPLGTANRERFRAISSGWSSKFLSLLGATGGINPA